MRLFRRNRKGPVEVQATPDPANISPFDREPITYVVTRVGDHWFTTLCANREEAMRIVEGLEKDGWYAFAGEASGIETAHWQLREAMRVFWSGTGPMPWTGLPRARRGEGMNVQLLRTSFEHAVNSDPDIVHHFYSRLFGEHPELRAYFPRQMAGQERALGEKLAEIMLHLEDPEYLSVHLAALGTRHAVQYRVRPEMYGHVKDALIDTLANAVPNWDQEMEQEWDGALTAVAGMMQAGARSAA